MSVKPRPTVAHQHLVCTLLIPQLVFGVLQQAPLRLEVPLGRTKIHQATKTVRNFLSLAALSL